MLKENANSAKYAFHGKALIFSEVFDFPSQKLKFLAPGFANTTHKKVVITKIIVSLFSLVSQSSS